MLFVFYGICEWLDWHWKQYETKWNGTTSRRWKKVEKLNKLFCHTHTPTHHLCLTANHVYGILPPVICLCKWNVFVLGRWKYIVTVQRFILCCTDVFVCSCMMEVNAAFIFFVLFWILCIATLRHVTTGLLLLLCYCLLLMMWTSKTITRKFHYAIVTLLWRYPTGLCCRFSCKWQAELFPRHSTHYHHACRINQHQ